MQDIFEEVRHVSVSIRRPPADVYRYASRPETWPQWAAGLGGSFERRGDRWIASGQLGEVAVRFTPPNELGVLDHEVTLPNGELVHNALRVIPNAQGAEVVFTIFRRPDMAPKTSPATPPRWSAT